jgi:hypothetical protein
LECGWILLIEAWDKDSQVTGAKEALLEENNPDAQFRRSSAGVIAEMGDVAEINEDNIESSHHSNFRGRNAKEMKLLESNPIHPGELPCPPISHTPELNVIPKPHLDCPPPLLGRLIGVFRGTACEPLTPPSPPPRFLPRIFVFHASKCRWRLVMFMRHACTRSP